MKRIEIKENNLNMVYEITDENEIKLLHFSNLPFDENDINSCEGTASFRPVEVLLSGLNRRVNAMEQSILILLLAIA